MATIVCDVVTGASMANHLHNLHTIIFPVTPYFWFMEFTFNQDNICDYSYKALSSILFKQTQSIEYTYMVMVL